MSESLEEQLIHFTRMHDRYIQDWNDAMASGDTSAVVFYELCIEKEDRVLARLFTIEKWELIEGRWMVAGKIEQGIQ